MATVEDRKAFQGNEIPPEVIEKFFHVNSRQMHEDMNRILIGLGSVAVPPLLELLRRDVWATDVCFVLGCIRDQRAVPYLIDALGHPSEWTKIHAAGALENMPSSRTVEPLIAALWNRKSDIRRAMTRALVATNSPLAAEPLKQLLKRKSVKGYERTYIEESLANLRANTPA